MSLPTMGSHLSAEGIPAFAFQHQSLLRSGLSQMFFNNVATRGFFSAADLWISLRQLLESRPAERLYAWVYWSELDTLGHRFALPWADVQVDQPVLTSRVDMQAAAQPGMVL